jgi:RND family efflux transporter MFP subunit
LAERLARVQLADAERLVTRYTSVNRDSANIAQSQIDTAIAAVDAARIALEQAQLNLDRRQIVAPFTGRVGITDIDVGDRIDTNTLITTLDDRATLLVDFAVPELFVGQVIPGVLVGVELWNSGRDAFTGQVIAVDSRINENSRAFTARAAIDNNQDHFRPGMAFEMVINVARGEFLTVPDVAVQWGADGPYVWIEDNGTAAKREVELVKRLPNRLLIEGDIPLGTPVITEGVQAVRAGVSLNSVDPAMIGLPEDKKPSMSPNRTEVGHG